MSKCESDKYKHYNYEVNGSQDYWMIVHDINILKNKYGNDHVHSLEIEDKNKNIVGIIVEIY
ncbi:hypothetical protein [Clostridium sp. UBA4395]|uniref:hypothetical protein n=1 Tax=Clostridium sp. UBA4395 TaxID=1946360 RepID=UPI00321750D2